MSHPKLPAIEKSSALAKSPLVERGPMRLGRYELVQKLTSGGMADVFLAHQPGPFSAGKLLVIKHLRGGMVDDDEFVQMFADESRIAVRLSHPNVVQTYEAVVEGDDYYLVLEFLDGKPLHQLLNQVSRARMPLALHLWILRQVLSGLHYAHELLDFDGTPMSIVHRDVSPSNVFVTYEAGVKLLDFGIAKSLGAMSATREGVIKGKLGYAAPEQCLCKPVDRRTDLYAVGVMLWEAIAGQKRPMGQTQASAYQARIQGTELRIEQVVPSAPRELITITNRALEQRPEARFQSALEFGQALDHYLRGIGFENGQEYLRSFMHEQFGSEMEEMRRRIEDHLGHSRAHKTQRALAADRAALSATSPESLSQPIPIHELSAEGSTLKPPLLESAAPVRLSARPRGWALAAAGGAVLLILAGTVASRGGGTKTAPSSSSAAAHESHAVTLVPARPAMEAASSTRSTVVDGAVVMGQVLVSIEAKPSSAELRLDGRRISNPYRAFHGKDARSHVLTVSQRGYQTSQRDLLFDRDLELTLSLTTQASLRAPANPRLSVKESGRNSRSTATRQASAPVVAPQNSALPSEAEAKARPASKNDRLQPGDVLRASDRPSREIDNSDPYAL
ncbi:MAG TPA: serine/threonine-protein kinase [Polyangiaceae bacterium]|nr:serine/threonine-protein kinase [Polyangiaceae bacterium]